MITRTVAVLVASTERTVPLTVSLAFVTPGTENLTVDPVVIGNVELPWTLTIEEVPGVRKPET